MKKALILLSGLFISMNINAQVKYDTLNVSQIGAGMKHVKISVPTVPWVIDVVEIDITNPSYKIKTIKAQDRLFSYELTTEMSKRASTENHQVIAAVNGDFFSGGNPVSAQVIDGEILTEPYPRELFGISDIGEMFINTTSYEGYIENGETQLTIDAINSARNTDALVFYNQYMGETTSTNEFGTEVELKAIDAWVVNGEVRSVITNIHMNQGNTPLSDSTFVLSGHGTSATELNNFSVGDTVIINHNLVPGVENIVEVMGGSRKFLEDGQNNGNWPERHPRTAIGFNQDTTKFYLATVDGRQHSSVGMTLNEFADVMREVGAYQALNLDGGGSTTLVINHKIANSPSGDERAVANALMLVSNQNPTGVLQHMELNRSLLKVFLNSSFTFETIGKDENYFPADINPELVEYSVGPDLNGSISSEGVYTAGGEADTGYVYVNYNGSVMDSAQVIVKSIVEMDLFPVSTVTDTLRELYFFTEVSDFDGLEQSINNSAIEWKVLDETVGTISTSGVFKGKSEGTTQVIATFDGISDTSTVEVQIEDGEVLLDSFEDNDFQLSGKNIDLDNTTIEVVDSVSTHGNGALKIDYQFTYSGTSDIWLYLEKDIDVNSVPDSLKLDARTDGKQHLLEINLADENDERFYIRVKKWADNTEFDEYPVVMEDRLPLSSTGGNFYYPITLKSIGIRLAAGQDQGETYSGTIFLDNLRAIYSNQMGVSNEKNESTIPSELQLRQNFPNPFNPVTNITFTVPNAGQVELSVFDVLGRKVATLIDGRVQAGSHTHSFDASKLSSGIYLYRLDTEQASLTRKMTLIK